MSKIISLDQSYSTTRLLIQEKPISEGKVKDKFETVLFSPKNGERKGEGGLRTNGYFKKSYDDKPLISIITVIFNGEEYLEQTIQSVINQSYDNVEFIIIDGGSTDGTVNIIKKYEDQIDYWVSEKDSGIYDAMNKGIGLASGEWINFMNAGDELFDNNVLKNIFYNVCFDKKYSVIAGCYQLNNSNEIFYPERKLTLIKYGELLSCHQALFFNKPNLQRDIYYDLKYKINSDNDIMMRIVKKGYKIYFSNIVVALFDTGGISSQIKKTIFPEKYKIIYKNFHFLGVLKAIFFNKVLRK